MLSGKRGFSDCAVYTGQFIDDLLLVLPLYGVKELWTGRHAGYWQEKLGTAFDIIRKNALKRHVQVRQEDRKKSYGLMHVAFATSPSLLGAFDDFWSTVMLATRSGMILWRSDGVYLLTNSPLHGAHLLDNELEPDYARFVKASAKLIAKKLRQG